MPLFKAEPYWGPPTNPFPFPDCSVVSHSRMLYTPSFFSFGILQKKDSDIGHQGNDCEDPFFLKQVW